MKNIIFIIIVILEICMGILTYLVLDSKNSSLLFQGGSIGSTMKMFNPNSILVITLFVFTVLSTILFRKNLKILFLSFLILFSLWFISGRTIGVQWNGELTTGWFFLNTNKVILANNNDCKSEIIKCTKATKIPILQLKLTNGSNEEKIFVGFTNRSSLKDYFNKMN